MASPTSYGNALSVWRTLFTDLSVFENVAFPLREHTDLSEELLRDL